MEPMTLGSSHDNPIVGNSPFLPSFLTGEASTSQSSANTLSPSKRRTISYANSSSVGISSPAQDFSSPLTMGHKTFFGQHSSLQQNGSFNDSSAQILNSSVAGPPTQGLFDSLRDEMNQVQTPRKSVLHQTQNQASISGYNQSFNESYLNQSNFNTSRATSPLPLYNSRSMRNDQYESNLSSCPPQRTCDFWVTVYGFPPSSTSMILTHFSQCGAIVEKVFPPHNGNWVHLKFSSRLECDKALNYNEKILTNNLMIGVTRCKDPNIIDKENLMDNSQCFKVRPLSQVAYKSKQCESSVVTCPPVPHKSSGIMDKAMDLLFGW